MKAWPQVFPACGGEAIDSFPRKAFSPGMSISEACQPFRGPKQNLIHVCRRKHPLSVQTLYLDPFVFSQLALVGHHPRAPLGHTDAVAEPPAPHVDAVAAHTDLIKESRLHRFVAYGDAKSRGLFMITPECGQAKPSMIR